MARHMNPSGSANKTIDAIDRKREREKKQIFRKARENSEELAVILVNHLMEQHIIEVSSDQEIKELMAKQLASAGDLEEFDLLFKIAPIRNITTDPNVLSLLLTQFITESLIDHPKVIDVFGDDLDIYNSVDAIIGKLRAR